MLKTHTLKKKKPHVASHFLYHGFLEDEITHVIDSRALSEYTLSEKFHQ
jgi:hypothetical protein